MQGLYLLSYTIIKSIRPILLHFSIGDFRIIDMSTEKSLGGGKNQTWLIWSDFSISLRTFYQTVSEY